VASPASASAPGRLRHVVCLVTDRRRLAQSHGVPLIDAPGLLHRQIAGAVAGGVDVVQIREPDLESGAYVRLVRDILALVAGTRARVLVNDRMDVALAAQAHGVHLKETSVTTSQARRMNPGLVGRSVHDVPGAQDLDADYLMAGTVFATESKPGAAVLLGLRGLADVVRNAGECPVWGIGGITARNVAEVVRAGATGIAAIGAFIPKTDEGPLEGCVQKLAKMLRFSFDSAAELL
jgi:thiamine-phosphate diphosphorylase